MNRVVSELIYEVECLADGKVETVHAAGLLPYRSNLEGTEVSSHLLRHGEHSEAKYEIIEIFMDIDEGDDGIMVLNQWVRLPDKCDFTWQSFKELYEDVPEALDEFLQECDKVELAAKAKNLLSNSNDSVS